mgnify:CR=1 FL=1
MKLKPLALALATLAIAACAKTEAPTPTIAAPAPDAPATVVTKTSTGTWVLQLPLRARAQRTLLGLLRGQSVLPHTAITAAGAATCRVDYRKTLRGNDSNNRFLYYHTCHQKHSNSI